MIPRGWKGLKYRAQNLGHTKDAFYDDVMDKCEHFHEMTGDTGDVILLHPLMVHSRSVNSLRIPRIITNPPISLKEPFNFDRADPKQFSLVERKTLHDLARNRLGEWKLEGKRAAVVPERVAQQEKMKKKELKRMKS